MRSIRRPKVHVPTLTGDGKGACEARSYEEDFLCGRVSYKRSFPGHWTEPDVRGALLAAQWQICAYCGGKLNSMIVDHFRPKANVVGNPAHGGYWWLAYCLDNYFLSCDRCNNPRHKGSKFPMRGQGTNYPYEKRHQLHKEPRALLDPSVDDIETWLSVEEDPETFVALRPYQAIFSTARRRVEKTLETFRLNRDPRLLRARAKVRNLVLQALRDEDHHRVRQLAVRYQPHSVVARALLEVFRPDLLPDPKFELDWLLQRMGEHLEHLIKLRERIPDEANTRDCKALLWSFAILWKDPPTRDHDAIESFLEQRGLIDSVRPYLNDLA